VITAAADIYGLAVMSYELLTGQVPFKAETPVAVLLAHMQEQPAPPSELNPSLPRAIDAVMRKALAKQPAERYGSATAFIEALEAVGRGEQPIEDSAAALGSIDATMVAADRRASVAAEVVAMVGTATARRRRRSIVLGGAAVAAALLVAAIWAIAHNAGASTAAHLEPLRPSAPLTGTPRGAAIAMRANGTTREQAALPELPSATPSATVSGTATSVPTATPTMITFPASGGDLPQAAIGVRTGAYPYCSARLDSATSYAYQDQADPTSSPSDAKDSAFYRSRTRWACEPCH
jgi:hypothetical protein